MSIYHSPSRYGSSQLEADKKDLYYTQIKADNFELRQNAKDYDALYSQFANLEHRYNMLRDEKVRIENELLAKNDMNLRTIATLRADLDALRDRLDEKMAISKDLNEEIMACKDIIDHRNLELSKMKNEYSAKVELNMLLRDKLKELENEIDHLRNERRTNLGDLDRMNALYDKKGNENADLQARISALNYETTKQNQRIAELNTLIDQKSKDLKEKEQALNFAERENSEAEKDIRLMQEDIKELENENNKQRTEMAGMQRENDEQRNRIADTTGKSRDLEKNLKYFWLLNLQRDKDQYISSLRKDIDNLRADREDLKADTTDLQAEIEALKEHTRVLSDNNDKLTSELDRFLAGDENVRHTLSERDRMAMDLKTRSQSELRKSLNYLEASRGMTPGKKAASPYGSPSPLKF